MNLQIKLYKEDELMVDKNVAYQKNQNIITFNLENYFHMIDLEQKIFKRENDEFCLTLNFSAETCMYELKEQKAVFDIIVDDSFWNYEENCLEIIYAIETNDEKLKIIIEFENKG